MGERTKKWAWDTAINHAIVRYNEARDFANDPDLCEPGSHEYAEEWGAIVAKLQIERERRLKRKPKAVVGTPHD